ncbi:hypothetical protein K490DRAFT_44211 [Saccharata proteae CBS 121410]|uniref:Signal recognition particle subunit SRP72 n=1 Tax=Saccharata proteae CBS 121410 TaxID=1314787 RepID=A0A9P4LZ13_9PEZI|nr:hypothetical protein K490DRAFT_44211 [Saccharata proteae CBS 121410]
MAAAVAGNLSSLLAQTHLDDHEEILKAANNALSKSKTDLEAQHIRVVALLKLDRFDDALHAFDNVGDKLKQKARLEYAYALYKSGRLEEAERIADSPDGRGIRHVLAQTAYRAENFSKAAELYQQLESPGAEGEDNYNDLKINSLAVDAQLQWQGQDSLVKRKTPGREDLEAFETAYNAACGSIARGELGQSEVLLKRAKDLCNASDELTEAEKKSEVMPIVVQQIYVLSRQGRTEEAEKLQEELSVKDIPDLSTRYIASVNDLAHSGQASNPYLASRKFDSFKLPPNDRPFTYQSAIIRSNAYVMGLLSNKHAGVARSTKTLLAADSSESTSGNRTSLSVVNVAAHAKGAEEKHALKSVIPLLEKRPRDIGLVLTVAQLYLLADNTNAAIAVIEAFIKRLEESNSPVDQDIRFAPGLVAITTSLYARQGRTTATRIELGKAASYWRNKTKTPPMALMKAAGAALLESQNPAHLEQAGDIFSALLEVDPSDRAATAGFIAAHATADPSKITESQLDTLTPVNRLIAGIDAAALENAGVASKPVPTQPASNKRPAPKEPEEKKKKRMRKAKMPKNYEEGKKVDPERWLPLKDRTYYKPKGKKGKAKAAGLTQGGVVDDKVEKAASGQVVSASGGQNKNKKKKGKR